jgi:hypothetical protein
MLSLCAMPSNFEPGNNIHKIWHGKYATEAQVNLMLSKFPTNGNNNMDDTRNNRFWKNLELFS